LIRDTSLVAKDVIVVFVATSTLTKRILHLSIVGAMFSNNHPFLHFHILHAIRIMISMAHCILSCLFILVTVLIGQLILGGRTLIDSQQDLAKLHLRNR
jgi:hypothetical protein